MGGGGDLNQVQRAIWRSGKTEMGMVTQEIRSGIIVEKEMATSGRRTEHHRGNSGAGGSGGFNTGG